MASIPGNQGSKIAMILLCHALITTQFTQAQCTASGPRNPGAAVSASFAGSDFAFSNPANCFSSDGSSATAASIAILFSGQTEYLKATNFGFSIPTTASICGIQVDVEKSAGNLLSLACSINDYSVRIIKNGVVTGSNKANVSTDWPTADAYISYGNNNELWLTSGAWIPADINASDFGIAFAADIHGLAGVFPVARINNIRITVYYLDGTVLPVQLTRFDVVNTNNNTAVLHWKPAEPNGSNFVVERSGNGQKWETVTGTPQKDLLHELYTFTDTRPLPGRSFYRLKMIASTGEVKYSDSRTLMQTQNSPVRCYPNPFTSYIQLAGVRAGEHVELTNMYGQRALPPLVANSNPFQIDVSGLQTGVYFISVGNTKMKIQKK